MKVVQKAKVQDGLSFRELRALEQELGIYIVESANLLHVRIYGRQYEIYDENEVYAGDVYAEGNRFSSVDELRQAILALDVWEKAPPKRRGLCGCNA